MANIHSLKKSITELPDNEALGTILDIREHRRTVMMENKKKGKRKGRRKSKPKKTKPKEIMGMAKKLTKKEKEEMLKLLKNKQ